MNQRGFSSIGPAADDARSTTRGEATRSEESIAVSIRASPDTNADHAHSSSAKIDGEKVEIKSAKKADVDLFGYSLAGMSQSMRFFVLCGGVFVCYLVYGLVQEKLLKNRKDFHFKWVLTWVQCVFYTVFSFLDRTRRGRHERRTPIKSYYFIGLLQMATLSLSNVSVRYLNYPTHVLFKSSKLLPVMLVNLFWRGKKHKPMEFVAASLLVLGLAGFTLGDVSVQPSFSALGVLLVSGAIFADALIGNMQEKAFQDNGTEQDEMVLWAHGIGSVYLTFVVVLSGELLPGLSYLLRNPVVFFFVMIFSFCGFLGVSFVMAMIADFGVVVAVTTTTVRKAVTIFLSFLFFPKPFSMTYLLAATLFFGGVYISLAVKRPEVARVPLKMLMVLQNAMMAWRGSNPVYSNTPRMAHEGHPLNDIA